MTSARPPTPGSRRDRGHPQQHVVDVVIAGSSPFDLFVSHELSRSNRHAVCNMDPAGQWLGGWADDCERLAIECAVDRDGERHDVPDLRAYLIAELVDERTPVIAPPGSEWATTPHGVAISGDGGSIVARYAIATLPVIRDVPSWCFEATPYPPDRLVHVDDLQVPMTGERLLLAGSGPMAANLYEIARRSHERVEWSAASEQDLAPARMPCGARGRARSERDGLVSTQSASWSRVHRCAADTS